MQYATLASRQMVALAAIGLLLVLSDVACRQKRPEAAPPLEVRQIWESHMKTLEGILAGGNFDQGAYRAAVEFFETTTGLDAHDDGTFVGRLPTATLRDDVSAWKAWYAQHGALLRLDPVSGKVRRMGPTPRPESRGHPPS